MQKDYAIIVAGGRGTRMGGKVAKQFMLLGGEPVLMHTLRRFEGKEIILVLPRDEQEHWRSLCREYHFTLPHQVADGGANRFESCASGVALIPKEADGDGTVVGIHDGVRPFVSREVICRCYEEARLKGAAIPVMPVTETLRMETASGWKNVDRAHYRSVQTPQCFRLGLIRRAYEQPWRPEFTDDASVVEALGYGVSMVEGNRENIKLTTPLDLKLGELLLKTE